MDTSPLHRQAFLQILEKYNIKISFDYFAYAGMKTKNVIQDVFARSGQDLDEQDISEISKEKTDLAIQYITETEVIYDGVLDLLRELRRQGVRLALASSASRRTVDLIAKKYDFASYFELILSGDDVQKAKPDPEIFQRCLQYFKISPESSVVIEDSVSGLAAAKQAGCATVAVLNDNRAEDFKHCNANWTCQSTKGLLGYL